MSFSGWLIKVNGTVFPMNLIAFNTYVCTPNQISDLDSYTDEDGKLHRNPLPHTSSKIEFNTVPMWLPDKMKIQQLIPERTLLNLEYWNDEANSYESGEFYVPDISYNIYDVTEDSILYRNIRIAFIEY